MPSSNTGGWSGVCLSFANGCCAIGETRAIRTLNASPNMRRMSATSWKAPKIRILLWTPNCANVGAASVSWSKKFPPYTVRSSNEAFHCILNSSWNCKMHETDANSFETLEI
jgi:hypothetical protein